MNAGVWEVWAEWTVLSKQTSREGWIFSTHTVKVGEMTRLLSRVCRVIVQGEMQYDSFRILTSDVSIFGGKCPLCGTAIQPNVEHRCANGKPVRQLRRGLGFPTGARVTGKGKVVQTMPGNASQLRIVWDGARCPQTVPALCLTLEGDEYAGS